MLQFDITVEKLLLGQLPEHPSDIHQNTEIQIRINLKSNDLQKVKERHLQMLLAFIDKFIPDKVKKNGGIPKKVKVIFNRKVPIELSCLLNELGSRNIECIIEKEKSMSSASSDSELQLAQLRVQNEALDAEVRRLQLLTDALLLGHQAILRILTPDQLTYLQSTTSVSSAPPAASSAFPSLPLYTHGMFGELYTGTSLAAPLTTTAFENADLDDILTAMDMGSGTAIDELGSPNEVRK